MHPLEHLAALAGTTVFTSIYMRNNKKMTKMFGDHGKYVVTAVPAAGYMCLCTGNRYLGLVYVATSIFNIATIPHLVRVSYRSCAK
jgi:hypothetical protein